MGQTRNRDKSPIRIRQFGVYLVNLNPGIGTKPGKIRPCIVIQNNALNEGGHPSTVVLPTTTQVRDLHAFPLQIFLPKGEGGLLKDSAVLVDQILAWDNRLFKKKLGTLSPEKIQELERAVRDFFGWP